MIFDDDMTTTGDEKVEEGEKEEGEEEEGGEEETEESGEEM